MGRLESAVGAFGKCCYKSAPFLRLCSVEEVRLRRGVRAEDTQREEREDPATTCLEGGASQCRDCFAPR